MLIKRIIQSKSASITLPASKSESNRALIIQALNSSASEILNLSDSNDSRLMVDALNSTASEIDIKDSGTAMRFLTAYFVATNQVKILKGTSRMHQRPIGILVEALRNIGAKIEYLLNDGCPPIKIQGLPKQLTNSLSIKADVSSQFISAILMIAPVLSHGLTLHFKGKVMSEPYINMTLALMEMAGIKLYRNINKVSIAHQDYKEFKLQIGADWSSASYWYAISAIGNLQIELTDLYKTSFQGDKIISDMMIPLGVQSQFTDSGIKLTPTNYQDEVTFDFSNCPDLAQTVMVVCAIKGIRGKMKGLNSLKIKETDRIWAMQNELAKIGAELIESGEDWELSPISIEEELHPVNIMTYDDHRMAMAFAPLCFYTDVTIDNPDVVQKSYPNFWKDLKKIGAQIDFS